MSENATPEMTAALAELAKARDGILRPVEVVEAAEPEDSPLHDWFEWEDGKAAAEYRLTQARRLIQVTVEVIERPDVEPVTVRMFTSLGRDREQHGGGYRLTTTVLSDSDMRQELLAEALAELRRWQAKYQTLKALAPVFAALAKMEDAGE